MRHNKCLKIFLFYAPDLAWLASLPAIFAVQIGGSDLKDLTDVLTGDLISDLTDDLTGDLSGDLIDDLIGDLDRKSVV